MNPPPELTSASERSLARVERLLDAALEDLATGGGDRPAARCLAALSEAAAELRLEWEGTGRSGKPGLTAEQQSGVRQKLSHMAAQLRMIDSQLDCAAEFYRGWCAAAAPAHPPAPGYGDEVWARETRPELLAMLA